MRKWWLPFFLPLSLFAEANDKGDFQIWNTDAMTIRLSPKTSFYGDIQFRYADDASKLHYKHIHLELNYSPNRYITLAPGYRMTWHRSHKKWLKENDPLLILTLFLLQSRHIVISNRNWVQYRNIPDELGGNNRFLYRNRSQILFPWQMGRLKLNPYVSDEIFWQEARGVFQNRAIIGFLIPRNQRAYFDLYYMYRSIKNLSDKWVYHNVLGLSAYFYF